MLSQYTAGDAPPWGTWLRTLHWYRKVGKIEERNPSTWQVDLYPRPPDYRACYNQSSKVDERPKTRDFQIGFSKSRSKKVGGRSSLKSFHEDKFIDVGLIIVRGREAFFKTRFKFRTRIGRISAREFLNKSISRSILVSTNFCAAKLFFLKLASRVTPKFGRSKFNRGL